MPMYLFTCSVCEEVNTKVLPVSQYRRNQVRCTKCGKPAYRDIMAEHRTVSHKPGNWPMHSDAAGVLPQQVQSATAEASRRGIPTEFTKDGSAIFTSQKHRKEYCEAHGMFDRNGSYGDPQKGSGKEQR